MRHGWDDVKKDMHGLEKDLGVLANQTWKGVEWCNSNAKCKAAAEKYGMMVVK